MLSPADRQSLILGILKPFHINIEIQLMNYITDHKSFDAE